MNNTEEKIFEAYLESKTNSLYFNQLQDITKASNSSLQNSLKKLETQNILKKEKTKSNTFYKINDKKIFQLEFSKLAYKKFQNLNPNVKTPLRNFLINIPKDIFTIILFGSTSRKEEHKKSDIDLLVISNKIIDIKKNKKEAELTSKYPISLFQASLNDFIENKDDVIIQARKTGFPICKEQNFYEEILSEYK